MKTTMLLCAMAASSMAAQPLVPRITADALSRLQQADPMIRLQQPAGDEAKVGRPENQSIIHQSTILSDGSRWTIVPQGAVVFTPENLKSRVNAEPAGELLSWNDFLTANHGWIGTCEVSFEQAAGKAALPEERTSFWPKQNKVIVAVHQRGPISARLMNPLTPPTP
jgi:hypothetical protein